MNAPIKFHPLTGEALKPIFVSQKTGRVYWPILGGSEPVVEPVLPPAGEPVVTIPVEPAPPAPRTFTAEQIAKARQEEKDKLYSELEKRDAKIKEFDTWKAQQQAEQQAAIDAAAAAAREEAEAEARKKFEEGDAKSLLAEAEQKWEQQFATLRAEAEQKDALFAKEQEFQRLREYAVTAVNTALQQKEIAPELAEFVRGNNEAEIDASLEHVKQKTQEIVQGIQQAQVAARAQMPGVSTAGYAATGPLDTNPGQKSYTIEELQAMPITEFAKHRSALLGAAATTQNNRGLYG